MIILVLILDRCALASHGMFVNVYAFVCICVSMLNSICTAVGGGLTLFGSLKKF